MRAITKATPDTVALEVFEAKEFVRASKAANTQRAYRAAWTEFTAFCDRRSLTPLPAEPQTIIKFVVYLSKSNKPSTIAVKLAGLSFAHKTAHQADPTSDESVRVVVAGIRRKLGVAPVKKSALTRDDLLAMVNLLDTGRLKGKRDRALLLVGFCGAFRRSELVALDVADVKLNGHMIITIRRSKTDQEGRGLLKHFEDDGGITPIAALQDWLDAAGIKSGAIFREVDRHNNVRETRLTSQTIALVVKSAARAAGLDWRALSGHSLRAGFITSAFEGGANRYSICEQTGHKPTSSTIDGYVRLAGRGALDALRAATRGGDKSEGDLRLGHPSGE